MPLSSVFHGAQLTLRNVTTMEYNLYPPYPHGNDELQSLTKSKLNGRTRIASSPQQSMNAPAPSHIHSQTRPERTKVPTNLHPEHIPIAPSIFSFLLRGLRPKRPDAARS